MVTNPHDSAFPSTEYLDYQPVQESLGLTIREKFAESMMAAMIANPSYISGLRNKQIAELAVQAADELIKALNES